MALFRPFSNVTSYFNEWPQWRKDMGLGPHRGVDFDCDEGDSIPASGTGVVTGEAWSNALGWWVVVRYATEFGDIYFGYCHMQSRTHLRYGSRVGAGDRVGYVGNTGSATTGAHLHLTASWSNGNPGTVSVVDPLKFMNTSTPAGGAITKLENLHMPALIVHPNSSVGFVSDAGELDPIGDINEVNALLATGIVTKVTPVTKYIWDLLTNRTARLRASQAPLGLLVKRADGSVGFISADGSMDVISDIHEVGALIETGAAAGSIKSVSDATWSRLLKRSDRLKAA